MKDKEEKQDNIVNGKDKVKAFDRKLIKKESYSFLIAKVLVGLLSGMGILMMLIMPIQYRKDFPQLPVMIFLISGMPITVYMANYMRIPENGQIKSIYTILKWMPVSCRDIYQVRLEYVISYCIKLTAALTAAQLLSAAVYKDITIWNILYPMGMGLLIFLEGWLSIYPWEYYRLLKKSNN